MSFYDSWNNIASMGAFLHLEGIAFYLSTVKHTKFQVEVSNPPHSSKSPFQIEHSKSPAIPSFFVR